MSRHPLLGASAIVVLLAAVCDDAAAARWVERGVQEPVEGAVEDDRQAEAAHQTPLNVLLDSAAAVPA